MSGSVVKRLVKDMKVNGFDQNQPVSDGHHRVEAAIKTWIDKNPVDILKP